MDLGEIGHHAWLALAPAVARHGIRRLNRDIYKYHPDIYKYHRLTRPLEPYNDIYKYHFDIYILHLSRE